MQRQKWYVTYSVPADRTRLEAQQVGNNLDVEPVAASFPDHSACKVSLPGSGDNDFVNELCPGNARQIFHGAAYIAGNGFVVDQKPATDASSGPVLLAIRCQFLRKLAVSDNEHVSG